MVMIFHVFEEKKVSIDLANYNKLIKKNTKKWIASELKWLHLLFGPGPQNQS